MASKVEKAAREYASGEGYHKDGTPVARESYQGFQEGIDWLIDRCEEYCAAFDPDPQVIKRQGKFCTADELLDFIKGLRK